MRLIRQEDNFGCGVACTSSLLRLPYSALVLEFGKEKAAKEGFMCKEIVDVLNKHRKDYCYKYIKPKLRKKIYKNGTIVYIKKCKSYPAGHYLVRYKNCWVDPWLNFKQDKSVRNALAGTRKRLPGKPIYIIFQKSS